MMAPDWLEESKRFDAAAEYYDVFRPDYPPELIDCIERESALGPRSRILEIGAGSGKASELFLNRGFELLCIEPGSRLAELGSRKHSGKKVKFAVSRFEDWDDEGRQFDLIFSAQAFHWVPQPEGYEKCARLLHQEGRLALFWNMYLRGDDPIDEELTAICSRYKVVTYETKDEAERRVQAISGQISGSGYFGAPAVYLYPWSRLYDTESFIGLLQTGNGYLGLSEADRQRVIREVAECLARNGGVVTRDYISALYISAKKD